MTRQDRASGWDATNIDIDWPRFGLAAGHKVYHSCPSLQAPTSGALRDGRAALADALMVCDPEACLVLA